MSFVFSIVSAPLTDFADTIAAPLAATAGASRSTAASGHIASWTPRLLLVMLVTEASVRDRNTRVLDRLRFRMRSAEVVWGRGGYPGGLVAYASAAIAGS